MKIETIDVIAKDWFDRINGNSYFSAQITINFGMKDQKNFGAPFQYGYSDHYLTIARDLLVNSGLIILESEEPLWKYCRNNNIILRNCKQEGCKKKDVLSWV